MVNAIALIFLEDMIAWQGSADLLLRGRGFNCWSRHC